MKRIEVINPDSRLLSAMSNVAREWVATCHSDTCCHASHDSGYAAVTGDVEDHVQTAGIGSSVHSHVRTIRVDDEIGQAEKALADTARMVADASPASSCSRAGERRYSSLLGEERIAERVLELVRGGMGLQSSRQQAGKEAAEAARAARRERRQIAISAMVSGGMTSSEAQTAYGIGVWSNEIDWTAVKRQVVADPFSAQAAFTAGARATTRREAGRAVAQFFGEKSLPRLSAWSGYALAIFFLGQTREREYPVAGAGWSLR